jgi:hypothetical protein
VPKATHLAPHCASPPNVENPKHGRPDAARQPQERKECLLIGSGRKGAWSCKAFRKERRLMLCMLHDANVPVALLCYMHATRMLSSAMHRSSTILILPNDASPHRKRDEKKLSIKVERYDGSQVRDSACWSAAWYTH